MANWQERLRKVQESSQKEKGLIEADNLRTHQREAELRQQEIRNRDERIGRILADKAKEEALSLALLNHFKTKDLLEDIRATVWKAGSVRLETNEQDTLFCTLSYEYADVHQIPSREVTDNSGNYLFTSRYDPYIVRSSTYLQVMVLNKAGSRELAIKDSACGGVLGRLVGHELEAPNAQKMFEDMLLESCARRVRNGGLPLELERNAKERVKKINSLA